MDTYTTRHVSDNLKPNPSSQLIITFVLHSNSDKILKYVSLDNM